MNIEPPKRRATDFCAGVKSVLAFLGGVLVLLMVLVSIGIATAHRTPGQHNEQWFFSQVCPHSSKVDSHARPEMPEVFFDRCSAEVKNHDLDLRLVMGRHPELIPELLREQDALKATTRSNAH